MIYVNVPALNLRSCSGTDYGTIGNLFTGDLLQVLEQKAEWLSVITTAGDEGWVHSDYIAVHSPEGARGNTVGNNIINGGIAALASGWFYY